MKVAWPAEVAPCGVPGWRGSAARWLLTLVPAYRDPRLVAEPLLLAHAAWWTLHGALDGTRPPARGRPAPPADLVRQVEAVRDALLRDAHRRARDAARAASRHAP